MRINWGFVSICLSEHDCSPAGNVTYASVKDLDETARRSRIMRVARRNLENTARIMWFLKAHQIRLYRISANMIPLATHPVTADWEWWQEPELIDLGRKIGRLAREHGRRLSSHLPEVCGLTSPESFTWMKAYCEYHRRLFDLLGLDDTALVIAHIGGAYGDKERALQEARSHAAELNEWIKARLALENDDRVYTFAEALELAAVAGVRVVCDWHHHVVNPGSASNRSNLAELLETAAERWQTRPLKVHVSSPRNTRQMRAHDDYVDPEFVRPFFATLAELPLGEVDVMVEAKQKDLALLRLRRELAEKSLPYGNGRR